MSGKTRFVLAGLGNVGKQVARAVVADPDGTLEIAAVVARHPDVVHKRMEELGLHAPVIEAVDAPTHSRILVECTTFEGFRDAVEPALTAGCHVIAVSVGALAVHPELVDIATRNGATLQIANGAMPGLDIIRAAREGGIESVLLESQILPASLAGEAWIRERGIDLDQATDGPLAIFEGTAREAAHHFPRHFNVAVALALAGAGLDRTKVCISANGQLRGAEHTVTLRSEVIELSLISRNIPSLENRRTSRIVAPSILAALREIGAPVRVGS